MVSVLPCKVTVTFFILLSNEIVCSKSLVRSDMKCILYVIASLFLNSMFTLYQRQCNIVKIEIAVFPIDVRV